MASEWLYEDSELWPLPGDHRIFLGFWAMLASGRSFFCLTRLLSYKGPKYPIWSIHGVCIGNRNDRSDGWGRKTFGYSDPEGLQRNSISGC